MKHTVVATMIVCLAASGLATGLALPKGGNHFSAQTQKEEGSSRRELLQGLCSAAILSTTLGAAGTTASAANAADEDIEVYFGCGCFWHVQHEFVEAERKLLGRRDADLTARAGYAGGNAGAKNGKVCYHNAGGVSDYGSLGHAEVVKLNIPSSAFPQFVAEYCNLFSKEGYRPDQAGDRGPEYRNLVGIPGGLRSPLAKQLVDSSIQNGDKLDFAKGKGDDPDRRGLVFVMDTADFPFFVAEQYHQVSSSRVLCLFSAHIKTPKKYSCHCLV